MTTYRYLDGDQGTTYHVGVEVQPGDLVIALMNGGNDKVFGGEGAGRFYLGDGDDYATMSNEGGVAHGDAGADTLVAGYGIDLLNGGDGIDTVDYSQSNEGVYVNLSSGAAQYGAAEGDRLADIENAVGTLDYGPLGSGHDVLLGSHQANSLWGLSGNDLLMGLAGDDVLYGGSGRDQLIGGAGADLLYGGLGDDIYSVDDAGDRVLGEEAGSGPGFIDTVYSSVNFTLSDGVEILRLGVRGARGTGNAGDNLIEGGPIENTLSGLAGTDTLNGGLANDLLIGGEGADLLDGGSGADTVSYINAKGAVLVSLSMPSKNAGDAKGDRFISIEHLRGGNHADVLEADDGYNLLNGGNGDDTIYGFGQIDTLLGGAGDDVLVGGTGSDKLAGHSGRDIFVFDASLNSSRNVDRIVDFVAVDDTIHLAEIVFDGLEEVIGSQILAGQFHAGSGLTKATEAEDRVIYDTATGRLFFDHDGTGAAAAIHFATLENKPLDLSAADFVVV